MTEYVLTVTRKSGGTATYPFYSWKAAIKAYRSEVCVDLNKEVDLSKIKTQSVTVCKHIAAIDVWESTIRTNED